MPYSWLLSGLRKGRVRRAGLAALFVFAVAGCGSPYYVDRSRTGAEADPAQASLLDPVLFELRPAFHDSPPDCVAVLPFTAAGGAAADDAETTTREHLRMLRRAFYSHLAPQSRRDVELSMIDAVLDAMPEGRRDDYRMVGEALGCDALLVGTMIVCGKVLLGPYPRVRIGAEVRLVRADDGTLLWEGRHEAESHVGTVPLWLPGIGFGVVRPASDMADEQLERVADDVARRLARTIPDEAPPRYAMADLMRVLTTARASEEPADNEWSVEPAAGE